jgi:hypothetical protein
MTGAFSGDRNAGRYFWMVLFPYDVEDFSTGDFIEFTKGSHTYYLRVEMVNWWDWAVEAHCSEYA